jgi:hypothetical protein|tara:strand:+ start:2358 stop:2579 length:222 start_codon:yes stop_codon:yes gene_type:complete
MWPIVSALLKSVGTTFLQWFWRKKENDRIADSVNAEIEIANLEKVSKGLRARDALHRLKYERMLKSARYKRKD